MLDLRLLFDGGKTSGSGHGVIGLFTFSGTLSDQGHVVMVNRYIGQHTVDYAGQYDGEGLLWGKWHIGPLTDRWMIKIARAKSAENTLDRAIAGSANKLSNLACQAIDEHRARQTEDLDRER